MRQPMRRAVRLRLFEDRAEMMPILEAPPGGFFPDIRGTCFFVSAHTPAHRQKMKKRARKGHISFQNEFDPISDASPRGNISDLVFPKERYLCRGSGEVSMKINEHPIKI